MKHKCKLTCILSSNQKTVRYVKDKAEIKIVTMLS